MIAPNLFPLAICILMFVSLWKIYEKAGKPGWAALIPFYNIIIELEIIGKPWWWLLMLFIPIANIVFTIMIALELGKRFGKDGTWSFFLLVLLSFIGYPILAFSDNTYTAPETSSNSVNVA